MNGAALAEPNKAVAVGTGSVAPDALIADKNAARECGRCIVVNSAASRIAAVGDAGGLIANERAIDNREVCAKHVIDSPAPHAPEVDA